MEEPKVEGASVCSASEFTVSLKEEVRDETLEGSVECVSQGQVNDSLSEKLVGGDGATCNGKGIMVEVLGTDVYTDGVELNDELGRDGSVDIAAGLDKDGRSLGGNGEVVNEVEVGHEGSLSEQSLKAESKNAPDVLVGFALQREEMSMGQTAVVSDHIDVSSRQKSCNADEGAKNDEAGTGVIESPTGDNSSREIEGPTAADVGEQMSAQEAGAPDGKVADTGFDNEELNSDVGNPMEIDRGSENSNHMQREIDGGAEVALGRVPFDSQEKKCFNSDIGQGMEVDEHFHSEDQETGGGSTDGDTQVCNIGEVSLTNRGGTSYYNHKDTGHALNEQEKRSSECLEKDIDCDLTKVDSGFREGTEVNKECGAEHDSLYNGREVVVEDRPERNKIVNQSSYVQGIPVPIDLGEQNLGADKISRSVQKDTQITDDSNLAQIDAEEKLKSSNEAASCADNQTSEFIESVEHNVTTSVTQVESKVTQTYEGEFGTHERQQMEAGELNDSEQQETNDGKVIKHAAMKPEVPGGYQACYQLPPEKEGEFSVYDMVWGKVRSHPWWPGQIFHPSDSSDKAMKHYKKDCFLVAYFGDRTFAWNEASQLKPFRTHFSLIAKQSNSETFHNAVDCALYEVSRRVGFGLACSCIPKDIYNKIETQTVENAGIREEINLRRGVEESLTASSFSPENLVEYLKTLSAFPLGGFDRLELVIAKAQLLLFYRLKGYSCLPEFQYYVGLDNDADSLLHVVVKNLDIIDHATLISMNDDQASAGPGTSKSQNSSRHKRKHNLKDGKYHKKKERSLSELIGGTPDSPDGDYWSDEKTTDNLVLSSLSKRRKTLDCHPSELGMQDGKKTISLAKISNSTSVPKHSFKIGDCIRRVASQLTKSPSISKCSGDRSQNPDGIIDGLAGDESDVSFQNVEEDEKSKLIDPTYSSLNDLLSLLQQVAHDPLGDYSLSNVIVSFFSDFRNSVIVGNYSGMEILPTDKVGNKQKRQRSIAGSPETFEFEDMSDTYWTDRVVENGPEEKPSRKNKKKDNQSAPAEPENHIQTIRRSKKQYSDSSLVESPEKPSGYIDENSPAELVMNFAELDSVPSEAVLNKMFRRFGALKESETEVDRLSSRARVVFKKCADAEVAFSSAKKFNVFGQVLVNYQLNYMPSALFKASSVATTRDQEMHLDFSNFEVHMI